jgi:hypothetical protein
MLETFVDTHHGLYFDMMHKVEEIGRPSIKEYFEESVYKQQRSLNIKVKTIRNTDAALGSYGYRVMPFININVLNGKSLNVLNLCFGFSA